MQCPEPLLSCVQKPEPFLLVSTGGELVFQNLGENKGMRYPRDAEGFSPVCSFSVLDKRANSHEAFFSVVYANLDQRRKTQLGS